MRRVTTNLGFTRGLLPRSKQPRKGDPLPSTMLGALSIVLGIVNVAALLGRGPESIPGLVKRAMIVLAEPDASGRGGKFAAAWWFVPEAGFWVLTAVALALATLGVVLSYRRGRPIAGAVGFGLNAVVAIAGFVLAFTDYRTD